MTLLLDILVRLGEAGGHANGVATAAAALGGGAEKVKGEGRASGVAGASGRGARCVALIPSGRRQ